MNFRIVSLLLGCLTLFHSAASERAPIGEWSFGVHLGVGQRSAFIIEQENVDFYVLPDIHYYDEEWFFDNGTLGYTFSEHSAYAFSAIVELNPYGFYFDQSALGESFNTLYVVAAENSAPQYTDSQNEYVEEAFVAPDSDGVSQPAEDDHIQDAPEHNEDEQPDRDAGSDQPQVSVQELPQPDLSIDGGFQFNMFSEGQLITVKMLTDISNQHSGMRARVDWSNLFRIKKVTIKLGLGFDWLDKTSTEYYFSAEQSATVAESTDTINPYLSITASYPLTKHIQIISHLKHLELDDHIQNSPLVNSTSSTTHFLGLTYRF